MTFREKGVDLVRLQSESGGFLLRVTQDRDRGSSQLEAAPQVAARATQKRESAVQRRSFLEHSTCGEWQRCAPLTQILSCLV